MGGFAGDKLGMTAWEDGQNQGMVTNGRSEDKEQLIDEEVKKLCDEAYETTKKMLSAQRPLMNALCEKLIEKETVDGFELNALVEEFTGKPPPTAFNPVPVEKSEKPWESESKDLVPS